MERVQTEEPRVYLSGDCWRFMWAAEARSALLDR
jgi:hypothetical protein